MGGKGTLRTSWKPRDQGGQGRKNSYVKQEPARPSPDPVRCWNPTLGKGESGRKPPLLREGPAFSPRGHRGTQGGSIYRLWLVLLQQLKTQPGQGRAPAQGSCWHCPSKPTKQPAWCGLDDRSSNHLGTLGLPTSVQNKVLRLLMIKMSPALCPHAMGLQEGQRGSVPLPVPLGPGFFPLQPYWEGGSVGGEEGV